MELYEAYNLRYVSRYHESDSFDVVYNRLSQRNRAQLIQHGICQSIVKASFIQEIVRASQRQGARVSAYKVPNKRSS